MKHWYSGGFKYFLHGVVMWIVIRTPIHQSQRTARGSQSPHKADGAIRLPNTGDPSCRPTSSRSSTAGINGLCVQSCLCINGLSSDILWKWLKQHNHVLNSHSPHAQTLMYKNTQTSIRPRTSVLPVRQVSPMLKCKALYTLSQMICFQPLAVEVTCSCYFPPRSCKQHVLLTKSELSDWVYISLRINPRVPPVQFTTNTRLSRSVPSTRLQTLAHFYVVLSHGNLWKCAIRSFTSI
jgi:hypothetical protein